MARNVIPLTNLIEQFERMPGIGHKSAQKLAFYILGMSDDEVNRFAENIILAKQKIHHCKVCCDLTDSDICSICSDERRDRSVICVVESSKDVIAIERTREYNGLYHVLHGSISPMNGIGPDEITIKELLSRLSDENIKEIIMATNPVITMKTTAGTITAELYPEVAPITVNNFISLINKGFYNGLIFHRVINGFMIQGGDPDGNGTGGPGYEIKGEFSANGFKNDLKHTLGVLSMARTMIPDSAGSQFFIMVADAPHLDGQYAAFGKITENAQAAVDISRVNRNMYNDMPKKPQVIKTIRVDTQGVDYPEPEKM